MAGELLRRLLSFVCQDVISVLVCVAVWWRVSCLAIYGQFAFLAKVLQMGQFCSCRQVSYLSSCLELVLLFWQRGQNVVLRFRCFPVCQ